MSRQQPASAGPTDVCVDVQTAVQTAPCRTSITLEYLIICSIVWQRLFCRTLLDTQSVKPGMPQCIASLDRCPVMLTIAGHYSTGLG